jgi:hypothetical protein
MEARMTPLANVARFSAFAIPMGTLGFWGYVGYGGDSGNPNWKDKYIVAGFAVASCLFLVSGWGILTLRRWTRRVAVITCFVVAPLYEYFILDGYHYRLFFDIFSSLAFVLSVSMILVAVWLLLPATRAQFKPR